MSQPEVLPQALIEMLSGFLAGLASTMVAHPLDLIKTRLQIDQKSSSHLGGSLRVVRDVIKNDGTVGGLYRGLSPNLVGNSVSWALYFLFYGTIKDNLRAYYRIENDLSYSDYFIASGTAGGYSQLLKCMSTVSQDPLGVLTAVCTNPIWVIKTRMLSTATNHPQAYRSMIDGARQISRSEGLRGFYRGLTPSLFGVTHGALQFMVYEQLKAYRQSFSSEGQRNLSAMDYLWTSSAAKLFAGSVTYPYQVIRSRLQMYEADKTYANTKDAVAQVWKREGLGGFYKGLGPNMLRVLPSTWVTFLAYEKSRTLLPDLLRQ